MKRFTAILLALVLTLSLFTLAGCSNGSKDAGTYKLGLGVVASYSSSSDASAESDGNAQSDCTAAAVVLDKDGKIVSCKIDVAQNKVGFTAEGTLSDPEKTFRSKKELGPDYNMAGASPIGKEWYEQAAAFEAYVVGKTADEVSGIAVDESTHPTDEALTAGCTMAVGAFISAVVEACNSAVDCAAASSDKLGLGLVTNMGSSKDATSEAEGLAQCDTTYAAVMVDANGKITAIQVDVTQAKINFSAEGAISTDLGSGAQLRSKKELGAEYNMVGASAIGKEWFEQAAAFETYVVGKTSSEVSGIAVDESNHPTDETLTAGCTMKIGDLMEATVRAVSDAQ